ASDSIGFPEVAGLHASLMSGPGGVGRLFCVTELTYEVPKMSNGSIASKPRIVLVDDDARLLTSLARGLEFRGFEVVAVASAEEALPYLRLEPPDVAVLDVSMPGMDGIAFCSLI